MKNNKEARILIAGFEIGGQMQLLVETMRRRWHEATAVAYNKDFRGYQNDVNLSEKGVKGLMTRFLFFLWALLHYDVFHFFWGVSLLSFWRFHLIDLPILRLFKKKIIVHFRGLDIVDIAYFDFLREQARGVNIVKEPPISRKSQIRKIKKWKRYADYILVSEPDLHFVASNSILSPQVIDLNYWRSTRRPLSEKDGVIRIVHAPSSRRKKGTDFIEQAIANLQAKGLVVELVLAEKLPHHKIKELYEISDIGIDQVLYGWHGKVSVELMALGKPVVCNINPEYKKFRKDLPIVHADPSNLEHVLEDLIINKKRRIEIGNNSLKYVKKYHDVEVVVDQLFELYGIGEKSLVKNSIPEANTW